MSEFTECLKWWIDRREGMTPTGLSRMAGLDKTAVRHMIVDGRSPRIDTALKITAALGVTLDQFLARDDAARRSELMLLLDQLTDSEIEVLLAAARGIADTHRAGSE